MQVYYKNTKRTIIKWKQHWLPPKIISTNKIDYSLINNLSVVRGNTLLYSSEFSSDHKIGRYSISIPNKNNNIRPITKRGKQKDHLTIKLIIKESLKIF